MGWLARAFGGDARGPRELDAALREALLAVLDRDLGRAEEMLTAAVQMDPHGLEPQRALARLYRARGEIGRAIRLHQTLLLRRELSSAQQTELLADLAADFRQGGFLRRAIASYEEVLARQPRHREALRALVQLLAQVRDHARALEIARRLARVDRSAEPGREAALLVEMAETAQAEGRSEDARRAVRRALKRDRRSVRAWILLGTLEAERDRSKAALAAWEQVPRIDRRSGPLVYPRIEATYAALGRAREYEELLRGLLREQGDDRSARLALARTLAARGDLGTALSELRRLVDADPDDLEVLGAYARLVLAEGRDTSDDYAALVDALGRRGLLHERERLG